MFRNSHKSGGIKVFWNADSWLPDNYEDFDLVTLFISRALIKSQLYNPFITAYGDAEKFTEELKEGYCGYGRICVIRTPKDVSEHGRLLLMCVDLVQWASGDDSRRSNWMVVSKLSHYSSKTLCKVVGSLVERGCNVLLALPEVDDVSIKNVYEQTPSSRGIPVWLCPHIFDEEVPQPEHGVGNKYFIEPPSPDPYTTGFRMSADVDTCVFWDVEDFPRPPGLQLATFYDNIMSAVRASIESSSNGEFESTGGMVIYAYVVKHEDPQLVDGEDNVTRTKTIVLHNAPAQNLERLAKISIDFSLWSMDNPAKRLRPQSRPNLVVISKSWEESTTLPLWNALSQVKCRGHNVFLAVPDEEMPAAESYDHDRQLPLLSWKRLSVSTMTRKRGRPEDDPLGPEDNALKRGGGPQDASLDDMSVSA